MYLLIFFLLLLMVFSIALFTELAYVTLNLNTDNRELRVNIFWLSKTILVQLEKTGSSRKLYLYFFHRLIVNKTVNPSQKTPKKSYLSKVGALELKQANCEVFYGFSSPFFTGISAGFLPLIQSASSLASIIATPDFSSDHEYLVVNAQSELNFGKTIVNLLSNKKRSAKIWNH